MVRLKQNLIFVHDLDDGNRWNEKYNLRFNPSEMVIKEVSYYDDGTQTGIFQLKSTFDNNEGLAIIQETTFPVQTDGVIQFKSPVGNIGEVEFYLENSSGAIASQSGTIFIHVMFMKKGDKTKGG